MDEATSAAIAKAFGGLHTMLGQAARAMVDAFERPPMRLMLHRLCIATSDGQRSRREMMRKLYPMHSRMIVNRERL